MSDITMCTDESRINVKYGFFDIREEREMARSSLKYIYTDMTDIKRSYFRLGFHLNEFKNCLYYEDFGYVTFEEFCEANFELGKSAVSRCINVFLMATAYNDKVYVMGNEQRGCASSISDKFKDFNYSQLCEMLPLSDEQRNKITPDMTVKQIREMKKKKVATSQPESNELILSGVDSNMSKVYSKLMEFIYKYDNVYNLCCDSEKLLFSLDGKRYKISCIEQDK